MKRSVSRDCPFCAIVEGRAPSSLVYEDDAAVAFLDLFPVNRCHTLVVPRRHITDLTACPADLASHLFRVCAELAPRIVRVAHATAFNVWTANGADAGQDIFHLHLHVLPRFPADRFGLRFPKGYPSEASRTDLDDLAAQIRAA